MGLPESEGSTRAGNSGTRIQAQARQRDRRRYLRMDSGRTRQHEAGDRSIAKSRERGAQISGSAPSPGAGAGPNRRQRESASGTGKLVGRFARLTARAGSTEIAGRPAPVTQIWPATVTG